jgi:outer membrane biosynthesis protein TonB
MPASDANVSGGGISKQEISKVVQRNKGAIRYCYESQLSRFPTLRGKVVVDFFIELDGSVRTVKVPTNRLSNKAAATKVISCLIRFIRRWRFPKPKKSKVQVIYPFNFGRSR